MMFNFFKSFIYGIIILFSLSDPIGAEELKINERVNSVYQAIVRIEVVSERGSNGRMQKSGSTGSGVIIDESGLVVTNHHVAGKATRLTCRLHDGEEVGADLLGADALTDLAVLRLRLEDRPIDASPLQKAVFGNSNMVKVGDPCFAMGRMWGNWSDGLGMMRLFFLVTVEVHWLMTKEKLSELMKLQSPVSEGLSPPTLPKKSLLNLLKKGT
jgi:hypothetical protein